MPMWSLAFLLLKEEHVNDFLALFLLSASWFAYLSLESGFNLNIVTLVGVHITLVYTAESGLLYSFLKLNSEENKYKLFMQEL